MDYSERIKKTLAYSDIFNYPLKKEEVWKYLIFKGKPKRSEFDRQLKKFKQKKGFYFLNSESLVEERIKKESINSKKITLAKKRFKNLVSYPHRKIYWDKWVCIYEKCRKGR